MRKGAKLLSRSRTLLTMADAPATIGVDMDVPVNATASQLSSSVPSLEAEITLLTENHDWRGRMDTQGR